MNKAISKIASILGIKNNSLAAMQHVLSHRGKATISNSDIWYSEPAFAQDGIISFTDYKNGGELQVSQIPKEQFLLPNPEQPTEMIVFPVKVTQLITNLLRLVPKEPKTKAFYVDEIYIDKTNVVYTDAHKLAWYPHGLKIETPFYIPVKVAKIMLAAGMTHMKFFKGDRFCAFIDTRKGNQVIYYNNNSKYPSYAQVIPDGDFKVVLSTPRMLKEVVEAKKELNAERETSARFKFTNDTLYIANGNKELVKSMPLIANPFGEFEIMFNINFMKELLTLIQNEQFILSHSAEKNRAVRLGDNLVLMPVMF